MQYLFHMNPASKSWPANVATSPAFRGRSIGHADGPDRADHGFFAKKPFCFSKINPRSTSPLSIFCENHLRFFRNQPVVQIGWAPGFLQKNPFLYRKSTRAAETLSTIFAKTSSDFSQINQQSTFDYISFLKYIS
jgi:hypothetical protein